MARATRNVDIKLQFEQFDMMPGPTAKRFQRNLLIHGGKSDTQGFSLSPTASYAWTRSPLHTASRSFCQRQLVQLQHQVLRLVPPLVSAL